MTDPTTRKKTKPTETIIIIVQKQKKTIWPTLNPFERTVQLEG